MHTGNQRRRFILPALAAVILITGLWFVFGYNREPRYEGHPLSYWFREYCYFGTEQPYDDDDEEKVQEAITTMGTNAVPYLLTMALDTNQDTPVWKALQSFFDEHFPHSRHRPRFVSLDVSRDRAFALIRKISPPAGLVLPGLRDVLSRTNTPGYSQGISVLSAVAMPTNGNDAKVLASIFTHALHGTDETTMYYASAGLDKLGSNGLVAIPDLITMLQANPATDPIRGRYAELLGKYGTNASPALPELQALFHGESNARDRTMFAAAICKIDLQDTEALAYLTNLLTNRADNTLKHLAESRLAYVGPRAASAIPALLDDLSTTNDEEWPALERTLNAVGASSDMVLQRSRDSLLSNNDHIREMAAQFILQKNRGDRDAQTTLVSVIINQGEYEEQAIIVLGNAGPAAKSTIPVVLGVLDGTNSQCWPLVPDALTNMGAPVSLFLPKLEDKLQLVNQHEFADPSQIEQVAGVALKFDPGNREIQLLLLRFYHIYGADALEALGNANPAVPEVKTRLREALNGDVYDLHRAALHALNRIAANEKKK